MENEKTVLEMMIDAKGLPFVLDALVDICHGKAGHILTNWHDSSDLAKGWTVCGVAITVAAERARMVLP